MRQGKGRSTSARRGLHHRWLRSIAAVAAAAVVGVLAGTALSRLTSPSPSSHGQQLSGHERKLSEQEMRASQQEEQKALQSQTPFDRALDSLPVHQQPLPVGQYETGVSNADITARLEARDSLCHRTLAARKSAVAWLDRTTAPVLARYRVTRFTLAVGLIDGRGDHFPLYAHVKNGTVSLTRAGMAPGRCDLAKPSG